MYIFDIRMGGVLRTIKCGIDAVVDVSMSPNGQEIIAGANDGKIYRLY